MEIIELLTIYLPKELDYKVNIVGLSGDNHTIIVKCMAKLNKIEKSEIKKKIKEYINMEVCMVPYNAEGIRTYGDILAYTVRDERIIHQSKYISTDEFTTCSVLGQSGIHEANEIHTITDKYLILQHSNDGELNTYIEKIYNIITGKLICKIDGWYTDYIEGDILYTYRDYDKIRTYNILTNEIKIIPFSEPNTKENTSMVEFDRTLNIFGFIDTREHSTKIYDFSGKLLYKLDKSYMFTKTIFYCGGFPTVLIIDYEGGRKNFIVNRAFMMPVDLLYDGKLSHSKLNLQPSNIFTKLVYREKQIEGQYTYYGKPGVAIYKLNSEKLYEKFIERQIQELC